MVVHYVQGLLTFEQQTKAVFDGFEVMLYPLSTVVAGFMLEEVNDSLGMTTCVIESVTPYMTKELMRRDVLADDLLTENIAGPAYRRFQLSC